MPKKLVVEVWSDVACPWCYIGKRRLETALASFPHAVSVEVIWRSFELDPSAPKVRDDQPLAAQLARKYGTTVAQAESMMARVTAVASAEGLAFDFARIRPGNTFDAHRLIHAGASTEARAALKERFLRAYFCEGEAMGEHATLARLASEVGLARDEAVAVLSSDAYAREVRHDEDTARSLGIHGVPFFKIGRYGISGAQPAALLGGALGKAWDETPEPIEPVVDEGAVCGPDGCTS